MSYSREQAIEAAARGLLAALDENRCKPGWFGDEWDQTAQATRRLRSALSREPSVQVTDEMTESQSGVIWIVVNAQGPIQAYEDRAEAEGFALRLGARVVSCALLFSRDTSNRKES